MNTTTDLPAGEAADDPRVLELVKAYQADLERGRRPDRSDYLTRHPDLAAALVPYLDGLDLLHRGAKDLTGSGPRAGRLDTGLRRGDRLGEYELVREVGRGGMGVVYEAVQATLNRRVAVKVLPAGFAADRTRLRRFTVEAQAAAAVAHPHIVPVYAVGEDRGVNFYVMRLIDGVALDALPGNPDHELTRLAATDRRAYHRAVARLGADVGRALDHAHQSGVVHRDVKPANLILDRSGHVWVTDFGLAQFADGPTVTRTGSTIGTLRYMSPEQAAGDRRRLDHRTDVYSLAATLYELLTGRPAFPADEPAVLVHQIVHVDPPPPREADPAVAVDLETVVLKALQKEPRDRYTTAGEFADDLERLLDGRAVQARRPAAWDRAKRWAGRHPAAVAAVLVSLLVVGAAAGVTAGIVAGQQRETDKAYQAERDRADEAERRFRQAKELSDLVLRISEEEIGTDSPFQGPRRRLLLAALENYRTLLTGGNDPTVRAELARVEKLLAEQAVMRESEAVFQLGEPSVREELNLTADQTAVIDRHVRPRGTGPGPDGRRLTGDLRARQELIAVLTPPQRQRLRQVFFQRLGPTAFNEPEVVEELRLTPAQRRQIKAIQAEAFALFMPPPQPGGPGGPPPNFRPGGPNGPGGPKGGPGGGPRPGGPPRIDPETVAKVTADILEVLTPEQRDTWTALVGKPFSPGPRPAPGERRP